ncbi:VOC family protein [Natronoglycomyces albus]|uniref:VOC family protein n=1 Tax=Natronoglycomyces albus TaxID=2811108 RepID=A0A895XE46_9ACTN|nr:VOC family protein [Natronoglycomyces albus]QSB04091.1 VOC family protein [Natronoglycomyces albus]
MPAVETRLAATVLGAADPRALGAFYSALLGWDIKHNEPDWVTVRPDDGSAGLSFQREVEFTPPVWPRGAAGTQRMHAHLDIAVRDLEAGVAWAEELGASQSGHQPQPGVCVMADPVGHIFCLFAAETL